MSDWTSKTQPSVVDYIFLSTNLEEKIILTLTSLYYIYVVRNLLHNITKFEIDFKFVFIS